MAGFSLIEQNYLLRYIAAVASKTKTRWSLPVISSHGMIGFIDALRVKLIHDRTPVSLTTILSAGINTPFFDKSRTRLGLKPRPSPPVYEPELVAEAILHAAEHPVRELYVGGAGKSMEWLHLLAPNLADWLLNQFGYRPQMTNTPKTDQAPHNLYEHVEGMTRPTDPLVKRQEL